MTDLVVVGSGFFGLTVAERMAEEHGLSVGCAGCVGTVVQCSQDHCSSVLSIFFS